MDWACCTEGPFRLLFGKYGGHKETAAGKPMNKLTTSGWYTRTTEDKSVERALSATSSTTGNMTQLQRRLTGAPTEMTVGEDEDDFRMEAHHPMRPSGLQPRNRIFSGEPTALNLFRFFDADGGGSISKEEFRQAMQQIGNNPSSEEIDVMFADADCDGDGEIDYREFLKVFPLEEGCDDAEDEDDFLMEDLKPMPTTPPRLGRRVFTGEPTALNLFNFFDADGGGSISKTEFRDALHYVGNTLDDQQIDAMWDQADEDRNGEIDFHEFRRVFPF